MVSVKANCIDSTAAPEAVFAREVGKMREERIKPIEQLTLEPFERGESFPCFPPPFLLLVRKEEVLMCGCAAYRSLYRRGSLYPIVYIVPAPLLC